MANSAGECFLDGVPHDWRRLLTAKGVRHGAPRRTKTSRQTIQIRHESHSSAPV